MTAQRERETERGEEKGEASVFACDALMHERMQIRACAGAPLPSCVNVLAKASIGPTRL